MTARRRSCERSRLASLGCEGKRPHLGPAGRWWGADPGTLQLPKALVPPRSPAALLGHDLQEKEKGYCNTVIL